jgi:hypothetical protein
MSTWSALQLAVQVAALASTDCNTHNNEEYMACELIEDLRDHLTNALTLDRITACIGSQDAFIASSILSAADGKWLATYWADLLSLVVCR